MAELTPDEKEELDRLLNMFGNYMLLHKSKLVSSNSVSEIVTAFINNINQKLKE